MILNIDRQFTTLFFNCLEVNNYLNWESELKNQIAP